MPKPKAKKRVFRRAGRLTKTDKAVVAAMVKDAPGELTTKQVSALSAALRRTPNAIRDAVVEAKESFNADALFYTDTHKQVVAAALANGDSKSLEVARKGSAWAMTNITQDGKRIIDKVESGPQGARILIGIKVGGVKQETVEALPMLEGGEEAEVVISE